MRVKVQARPRPLRQRFALFKKLSIHGLALQISKL
jgi:hypothetical protein